MSDEDDDIEHPALKDFSEGTYKAQYVAKKTLKGILLGVAIGAVALTAMAAVAAIFSIPMGGLLAAIGISTDIGSEWAMNMALKTLQWGAIGGSVVGGAWGLISGTTGADEAADERKEDIIAQSERREVRRERVKAVEMQTMQQQLALENQAQQLGVAPAPTPMVAQTGRDSPFRQG